MFVEFIRKKKKKQEPPLKIQIINSILSLCTIIIIVLINKCHPDLEDEYNDYDEASNNISVTEKMVESTFQVPDDKFTATALKDIAHYLRNYKFNEWDQRFDQKEPVEELKGYYDFFPEPHLQSLHWKVHKNCNENFYKCISYLYKVIETVPFSRKDDVITILNEKYIYNVSMIKSIDKNCHESRLNSERNSLPFESSFEKFQWRTTAAYYMCWYTMIGTPALLMLGEVCDNFANCLDPTFGHRNHDPRSDDKFSFACAMYSFCPDPCCPLKHVTSMQQCHDTKFNPCYEEHKNSSLGRKCSLDRQNNKNLNGIVTNKWNLSCNCRKKGFIWKSQFGICVDINECLTNESNCDNISQDCLNVPGSFVCICKWGYQLDKSKGKCVSMNNTFIFKNDIESDKNSTFVPNILNSFLHFFAI